MLQTTLLNFQICGKGPFQQAAGSSLVEVQSPELDQCTQTSTAQLTSKEGCCGKLVSAFIYEASKLTLSVHTV